MSQYDVVVIGGGAAGLSSALVLSRARRKVLVVDAGDPRNAPATHLHGYLSRDGIPPDELLAAGRHEVKSYGGDIIDGTVTDLVPDGRSGFWALLAGGQQVSARRLLVTTGLRDELPAIPGLRDRWARDVLHCPYCHGYEVRGRKLGVLGGTPGAVQYAQVVRQWTHDLLYFTPPGTLTAAERTQLLARAIGVVEGTIEALVIDDTDHLRGLQMHGGCVIRREALFVPPRFVPNNHLLVGLGCDVDANAWVTVDNTGRTSVPESGPPETSSTPAPRSSPPQAPAPRPPSPSTPTSSRTTCATPSATSTTAYCLNPPPAPTRRSHHEHHTAQPEPSANSRPAAAGPPTKHQLALMIWLAVFPTLTALNVALGGWLGTLAPVVRTFVLATIAVPIVIYALMPQLHRLHARLLTSIASN